MLTRLVSGILPLAMLLAMAAPLLRAADDDPATLLAQLNGDDFDARRSASEKLEALGERARGALEQAAKSEDPEVRDTAARLLDRLQKFVLTFAPFDRDGKPIPDAEASATVTQGENSTESTPHQLKFDKNGKTSLVLYPPNPCSVYLTWKNLYNTDDTALPTWGLWFTPSKTPLSYTLSRGGSLEVMITGTDGKAVKDAHLDLYGSNNYMGGLEQETLELQLPHFANVQKFGGVSGDDGKLTIEHVPDGVYQCVVHAEGYIALLAPRVRIHEGRTATAPEIKLTAGVNGKFQFTLLQKDGTPYKGKNFEVSLAPVFEGPKAVEKRRRYSLYSQWFRRGQPGPAADDKGKVTVENIAPGKYELTIRTDGVAPQNFGEVTLTSGQTLDLGERKVVQGGNIKGKLTVNGQEQIYTQVFAVPEQTLIDSLAENSQTDWRYMRQDYSWSGRTSVQSGGYEIKNLMPGKYAVIISSQFGVVAYGFGIEVVAGETAQAPAVVLNGTNDKMEEIKGIVLTQEGAPAVGVSVTLVFENQGQWGNATNDNGVFQFQATPSNGQGKASRLQIKAAGYKAASVDLLKEHVNLQDIRVQLEKQHYGTLNVKVVDEAGQPVVGAAVAASDNAVPRRFTNKYGETTISGLSAGARTLTVSREGYYLKDGNVDVAADTESKATLVLVPGLSIKGRVQLPEGALAEHVSVWLQSADNKNRVVPLLANSEFTFTGILAGEYTLRCVGPALACTEALTVSVAKNQKELAPLKLSMVRPVGTAVNVGTEFEGMQATLAPHNFWSEGTPSVNRNGWNNGRYNPDTAGMPVDSTGRVEFWGLAPGNYDLQLTMPGQAYRWYGRGRNVPASVIVPNVTVEGITSVAALATAPAKELKLEPRSGKVVGLLTTNPPTPAYGVNGMLNLKLVGTGATGTLTYNFPQDMRAQSTPIQIVGKAPPGLNKPHDPGTFQFENLPPGDYSIVADLMLYRYRTHRQGGMTWSSSEPDDSKRMPQTLKTFSIKAGETLEIGTLRFDLTNLTNVDVTANMEIEDHVPEFNP